MQHQKAAKQAGVQESRPTHTPEQSTPAAEDVLLQRALEQAESAPLTPALMRSLNRLAGNHAANGIMQRRLGTVGQIAGARLMIQRNPAEASTIANGHSYDKHVITQAEFPGINSKAQFATVVSGVMTAPDQTRNLSGGRIAYWKGDTVVIYNPNAGDKGTCFKPTLGKTYFDNLT